jgi:predicted O-methyltransferase YrrM
MPPHVLPENLDAYLEALVPPRSGALAEMESFGRRTGFPIIGPTCGHFCYLVTKLIGARQVFEMGSGYGYSTVWFARAVAENGGGRVVHTVLDPELSGRARAHLEELGLARVVEFRVEEARQALQTEAGPFDLIFIDIEKEDYPAALEIAETKIRPGGVMIADNMFLSGEILDRRRSSPRLAAVRAFTQRVLGGDGWIGSIVPMRDGLMLAQKR